MCNNEWQNVPINSFVHFVHTFITLQIHTNILHWWSEQSEQSLESENAHESLNQLAKHVEGNVRISYIIINLDSYD